MNQKLSVSRPEIGKHVWHVWGQKVPGKTYVVTHGGKKAMRMAGVDLRKRFGKTHKVHMSWTGGTTVENILCEYSA